MNKLKSFTMIEVIMALVIASMASMYVIKNKQHANFNEAIINLQDTIQLIVEDGIISDIGYASGTGNNCSPNLDFTDLNDVRLLNCLGWYDSTQTDIADRPRRFTLADTDSNQNIIGNGLMENYGNCLVNVAVAAGNARQFDIFVDCSNVQFNNKSLAYLEDALRFTFENKLNYVHISTDENAISIDDNILSGTNVDGQIRARFEL